MPYISQGWIHWSQRCPLAESRKRTFFFFRWKNGPEISIDECNGDLLKGGYRGVGNGKEVRESLASGHHDNDSILKEA